MKEYILIKLRSGEEIIASLMSKNRNSIKVLRPMQIRQVPFMDHMSGSLKAAVVMENWIGRTDSNEVTIPNNWVGIKMLPSDEVIAAYERYMKNEDTPKEPPQAPKTAESALTEKEHAELKRIEDEMRNMLLDTIGDDSAVPPIEPMENFLKGTDKNSKDMVIVNFMFPSNIFKNMMEEGLIDDLLSAGMSYNDDNGDDSDEDLEDDVDFKPKPKKIRENDVDMKEKGNEPYGNSFRDWSSNPSDYL